MGITASLPFARQDEVYTGRWSPLQLGLQLEVDGGNVLGHAVWAMGTWALWLDTQQNGQQQRKGRTTGLFQAICDLAGAIESRAWGNTQAPTAARSLSKRSRRGRPSCTQEEMVECHMRIPLSSEKGEEKLKLSFAETYCRDSSHQIPSLIYAAPRRQPDRRFEPKGK